MCCHESIWKLNVVYNWISATTIWGECGCWNFSQINLPAVLSSKECAPLMFKILDPNPLQDFTIPLQWAIIECHFLIIESFQAELPDNRSNHETVPYNVFEFDHQGVIGAVLVDVCVASSFVLHAYENFYGYEAAGQRILLLSDLLLET